MGVYYNEFDTKAAAWLRGLIKRGLIADGDVDERDLWDVEPSDLRGFTQVHLCAGIGVWSYALRRAGWADDRPVWTGSFPCQPFSAAGKGAGFADERHLWPAGCHLIRECRPGIILGEQVASKDAEPWLDLVQTDLEELGYAFGACAFPSAGVGAPHIRDRTYWVADADGVRQQGLGWGREARASEHRGADRVADASGERRIGRQGLPTGREHDRQDAGRLEDHDGLVGLGEAGLRARPAGPTNGLWRDADWLFCRDGKWRPVEPGTFPLAHGAPARVGRLRGYGNAINAEAAQAWIESYIEAREEIGA